MKKYTFKFKNEIYELTNKWEETSVHDSKEFQMQQFKYLLEIQDYQTMENRINNQIMLGYVKKSSYIS